MSNVSLEVRPSHTNPYINTIKKVRKQPTAAVAEPSQFHNSHFLHVSDRKSVLNGCVISAHRIATSYGPDCLDPFLHYHDTLIRANVD